MNYSEKAGRDALIAELNDIELLLQSHLPTTLWISDLHGEGERFKNVLRGRFGVLYQTCAEALPKGTAKKKVEFIASVVRRGGLKPGEKKTMEGKELVKCLRDIIRYKLLNSSKQYRDVIPKLNRKIIFKVLHADRVPELVFENPVLFRRLVEDLCVCVKHVLIDHLVMLGDIFDRGPDPDKIIRILKHPKFLAHAEILIGNHDVLWMGACAGNLSLAAETLRITYRYGHVSLLKRLGFQTEALERFAEETYPVERIGGKFKAPDDLAKSVEKALAMIQFKLEEACLLRRPEYGMEGRRNLEKLARDLDRGETEHLLDTDFPTLDRQNPLKLDERENALIRDVAGQFRRNKKMRSLIKIFFVHGMIYEVHNSILNLHALVPSNENGEFQEFMGKKGKALMDEIQRTIRRVGRRYLGKRPQAPEDLDLMFYLWCGPVSPLFGKNAMKTFERYFFKDEATHKETTLYWEKNLKREGFRRRLKEEFQAERVIYGHTPRDYTRGQKIADEEGFAINVDGGFAQAYFNRGHALVNTPYQLYGIVLPTPDEAKKARIGNRAAPIEIEMIKTFPAPVTIGDTVEGKPLLRRRRRILRELRKYDESRTEKESD